MIYCIGDSHIGGLNKKPFCCLAVGAATAYGLLSEKSDTQSKKKIEEFLESVPSGSWLVVNFGEVDCRSHLNKFSRVMEATKETVKRYFTFIDGLKDFKVIVWCPVPNIEKQLTDKQLRKQGKYPIAGTYLERLDITQFFCSYVKKEAEERNLPVVDVYRRVVGCGSFYKDMVHLNKEGYSLVKKEIYKICQI